MPQQTEDEIEDDLLETMIHTVRFISNREQKTLLHTYKLDYRMVNLWCRMCLKFSTPSALEFWRLAGIPSTHRISLRNLSSIPVLKSECQAV